MQKQYGYRRSELMTFSITKKNMFGIYVLVFYFFLMSSTIVGLENHHRFSNAPGIYNDRNRSKVLSHHEEFILNNREFVDMIFIFDNPSIAPEIFRNWRMVVEGYDVIIFGHDSSIIDIPIPSWMVSYDIYQVSDMQNAFEVIEQLQPAKKRLRVIKWFNWLVNQKKGFGNHTLILRNYASWVSYKKYIYIIDNDGIPHDRRLIEKHISNMKAPPTFFDYRYNFPNATDLKEDSETYISYGLRLGGHHISHNHIFPRILKSLPHHHSNATHRENSEDWIWNTSVTTLPVGPLFYLPPQNMMVDRSILGPGLMFFTPFGDKDVNASKFDSFIEIFAGLVAKKVTDTCRAGIKVGAPFTQKRRHHGHNIHGQEKEKRNENKLHFTPTHRKLYTEHEHSKPYSNFPNISFSLDQTINFFNSMNVQWNNISQNAEYNIRKLTRDFCGGWFCKPECVFVLIAEEIKREMATLAHPIAQPYFTDIYEVMRGWAYVWQARHGFAGTAFAKARKSSHRPYSNNTSCALVTIVHNERRLFKIWLRYYRRHFSDEDIFILDHQTDDGSLDNLPDRINYIKLYGNKFLMPVAYRSHVIKTYQDRLLRGGYKCVVFSDTDEIIIANPLVYKEGLKSFLTKFADDSTKLYYRVVGRELAHLAYGNGTVGSGEPPLDWDKSILLQRSYYVPDNYYNKPLLTKVPLSYKHGFHKLWDPQTDYHTPYEPENLHMLHIRSMDYTFCMEREEEKYAMTLKMDPKEIMIGMASHWANFNSTKRTGELCRYANGGYFGVLKNTTNLYDNRGEIDLMRLEPHWRLVDL